MPKTVLIFDPKIQAYMDWLKAQQDRWTAIRATRSVDTEYELWIAADTMVTAYNEVWRQAYAKLHSGTKTIK